MYKMIGERNIWDRLYFCLIYSSLFMFGLMYAIIPTYIMAIVLSIIVIWGCFRQKYVVFNFNYMILFQFVTFVAVIELFRYKLDGIVINWRSNIFYAIVMPLVYLLGKIIVGLPRQKQGKELFISICSLQAGMFIQGVLDLLARFIYDPTPGVFEWPSFWEGDIMARNNYEYEFVFITAAFFFACLYYRHNKKYFFAIGMLNIVIQIIVFYYQGRQNTTLFFGNLLLILPIYSYNKYHNVEATFKKKMLKIYLILILLVLIGLSIIKIIASTTTKYFYWTRDGGIFNNVRVYSILDGLKLSIEKPNGGWLGNILPGGTTHNMALQYSQNFGTAVFLLIELFMLLAIFDGFFIVLNRKITELIKYLLFLTIIDLRIYHTLDPNGYNRRYYFLVFILLAGIIRAMIENMDYGEYQIGKLNGKLSK